MPEPAVRESSRLSEERRPGLGTAQVSDAATLQNPQNCLESLSLQSNSVQQTFFEHLLCDKSWGMERPIKRGPYSGTIWPVKETGL